MKDCAIPTFLLRETFLNNWAAAIVIACKTVIQQPYVAAILYE